MSYIIDLYRGEIKVQNSIIKLALYISFFPQLIAGPIVRYKDIESQLEGSKFGIAYIDSTEHITQLNRPLENNLMKQVEYLTGELYGQLGLTEEIINGTASEQVMLNYNNRTVEPVLSAIIDAMKCTFLTKTARTSRIK